MRFFATVARNLEPVLAEELGSLGLTEVKPTGSGVWFEGSLEDAYRACLWSRIASSILLPISSFEASTPEQLYEGAKKVKWSEHMDLADTFAVQVSASRPKITHTHYAALRVKDAIADQFREKRRARPSVDLEDPDLYVHLHLHEAQATLSIDLSGRSLHRRGWRVATTPATLKENLAAAILWRARWHELMKEEEVAFLDPMCGSGTFPIEAWMIAADIAPGLDREDGFGFETWRGHDRSVWKRLLDEARGRREKGSTRAIPRIIGYDKDHNIVKSARENVREAGAQDHIQISQREILEVKAPSPRGLMVVNPPYGERLEDETVARDVHKRLGSVLIKEFDGWRVNVLTTSKKLGMLIPLRAVRRYALFNGPLSCTLLHFEVTPERIFEPRES